jgi:hypothetical protein
MLQAAIEHMQLKEERKREQDKMENEFKKKLMEKFAEDERLEQYNMQRRRMKEIEFKKEVRLISNEISI